MDIMKVNNMRVVENMLIVKDIPNVSNHVLLERKKQRLFVM